jgi:hypothetical protein
VCRKNDAANSTDSQFYGINNSLHLWENIPTENSNEKANWYRSTAITCSDGGIPCFGKTHSLFRAEQGIIRNKLKLRSKLTSGSGGKSRKRPETSKIPCYFPCSQGKGAETPATPVSISIDRGRVRDYGIRAGM